MDDLVEMKLDPTMGAAVAAEAKAQGLTQNDDLTEVWAKVFVMANRVNYIRALSDLAEGTMREIDYTNKKGEVKQRAYTVVPNFAALKEVTRLEEDYRRGSGAIASVKMSVPEGAGVGHE